MYIIRFFLIKKVHTKTLSNLILLFINGNKRRPYIKLYGFLWLSNVWLISNINKQTKYLFIINDSKRQNKRNIIEINLAAWSNKEMTSPDIN